MISHGSTSDGPGTPRSGELPRDTRHAAPSQALLEHPPHVPRGRRIRVQRSATPTPLSVRPVGVRTRIHQPISVRRTTTKVPALDPGLRLRRRQDPMPGTDHFPLRLRTENRHQHPRRPASRTVQRRRNPLVLADHTARSPDKTSSPATPPRSAAGSTRPSTSTTEISPPLPDLSPGVVRSRTSCSTATAASAGSSCSQILDQAAARRDPRPPMPQHSASPSRRRWGGWRIRPTGSDRCTAQSQFRPSAISGWTDTSGAASSSPVTVTNMTTCLRHVCHAARVIPLGHQSWWISTSRMADLRTARCPSIGRLMSRVAFRRARRCAQGQRSPSRGWRRRRPPAVSRVRQCGTDHRRTSPGTAPETPAGSALHRPRV